MSGLGQKQKVREPKRRLIRPRTWSRRAAGLWRRQISQAELAQVAYSRKILCSKGMEGPNTWINEK